MPEAGQLYADLRQGERAEAMPPTTVTSSATGRMQFSIQLPAPPGVPVRPEVEEPQPGT